jgi:prepilin-type N-terminal cleavage/methylation domain-containing protein
LNVIARIRKSMDERDGGFTLVELLVVMIIIGILAAIAIPVFLSQQKKARDTSAKADVSTIGKAITSYYVDGTAALTYQAEGAGWSLKDGTTLVDSGKLSTGNVVGSGSATSVSSFCVSVKTSDDTATDAHVWKYTQDGLAKGGC